MAAPTPAPEGASAFDSLEAQAFALWSFLKLKNPRFDVATVLAIVQRLAPHPGEDVKQLAKRLKLELAEAGVSVKHVIALEAAARLLGRESWFSAPEQAASPALSLQSLVSLGDITGNTWRDLYGALVKHGAYALSTDAATALQVEPSENMLTLNAVTLDGMNRTQPSPLCVVLPGERKGDKGTWLNGAAATFESLRRRFEETGQALVEGLAVLALCVDTVSDASFPPSASALTELVLLRMDGDAHEGYEIARGNEFTCWSQFELASQGDGLRSYEQWVTPDVQMDGAAWRCGDGRYEWQLARLSKSGVTTHLTTRELSETASHRLLRRYVLARKKFGGRMPHFDQPRNFADIGRPEEVYRVSVRRIEAELAKANLTWDAFVQRYGTDVPLSSELPAGALFSLLEMLDLDNPASVLRAPSRKELQRVNSDDILRALAPRAEHVRYYVAATLPDEQKTEVREAIQEFADGMQARMLMAAGNIQRQGVPLPNLVYAAESEELRARLDACGLTMYVGLMPNITLARKLPGYSQLQQREGMPPISPLAWGTSLFIEVDVKEAA